MPRQAAAKYARIAITLPEDVLVAADRLAKALDRPRSWVIAEATRQFAGLPEGAASARGRQVTPTAVAATDRLGPLRRRQLRSDLQLSPTERLKAIEETLRLDEVLARRDRKPRPQHVMTFETLEDYIDWKRRQDRLG